MITATTVPRDMINRVLFCYNPTITERVSVKDSIILGEITSMIKVIRGRIEQHQDNMKSFKRWSDVPAYTEVKRVERERNVEHTSLVCNVSMSI